MNKKKVTILVSTITILFNTIALAQSNNINSAIDKNTSYAYTSSLGSTKLISGKLYRIETTKGFCVAMPLDSFDVNGARAKLEKISKGRLNQWWYVLPYNSSNFCLINFATGKALEVTGDSQNNDAQIGQWAIAPAATNQRWKLKPVNKFYSALENVSTGKVMDIPWCDEYEGQVVNQYEYNGCSAQQYKFTVVSQQEYGSYTYR